MSKKLRILFTGVLTIALLLTGVLSVSAARPGFPTGGTLPGRVDPSYVVSTAAPADSAALKALLEDNKAQSLSLTGKTYTGMGDVTIAAADTISGGSIAGDTITINAPAAFYGVTISANLVVSASSPVLFQGCTITGTITANSAVYFDNVRWNNQYYYVVGSYSGGCLNNTSVCPYNWTTGFIGGTTSTLYPWGAGTVWNGTTLVPVSGYTYYMPFAQMGNIYVVSFSIYCPDGTGTPVTPSKPVTPSVPGTPVVPSTPATTSAATILANCKSSGKINAAKSSSWTLSGTTLVAKSSNSKKLNRIAIPAATARDMAASGIKTLAFSTPNGVAYVPASAIKSAIDSCNVVLTNYVFEVDVIRVNDKTVVASYEALGGRALAAPTKVIVRLYNSKTGTIYTVTPTGTQLAQATGLTAATATLASAMYNGTQFVYTGDKVSFSNGTIYMPVVSGRILVPVK